MARRNQQTPFADRIHGLGICIASIHSILTRLHACPHSVIAHVIYCERLIPSPSCQDGHHRISLVLVVNKERNIYKHERNRMDWGLVKREEGGREGMGRVKEKMQGKEGRGEEMEERNIEVKTLNSTFACNMTLIITMYKTRFCQVYGPGTVTSTYHYSL